MGQYQKQEQLTTQVVPGYFHSLCEMFVHHGGRNIHDFSDFPDLFPLYPSKPESSPALLRHFPDQIFQFCVEFLVKTDKTAGVIKADMIKFLCFNLTCLWMYFSLINLVFKLFIHLLCMIV